MRAFLVSLCCLALMVGPGCSKVQQPSNKILVWHWMTDRHDSILKLAKQYKEQTGIDVAVELFAPSDAYSQKIIAAAQAAGSR